MLHGPEGSAVVSLNKMSEAHLGVVCAKFELFLNYVISMLHHVLAICTACMFSVSCPWLNCCMHEEFCIPGSW